MYNFSKNKTYIKYIYIINLEDYETTIAGKTYDTKNDNTICPGNPTNC